MARSFRPIAVLFFLFLLLLGATTAAAQGAFGSRDHRWVFDNLAPSTFPGPVGLLDQFRMPVSTDLLVLEKASVVVHKNQEEIYDPTGHTWWNIGPVPPQEEKIVTIANQFGFDELIVYQPKYLLNPSTCDLATPSPGNHYLCYEVRGPERQIPVLLATACPPFPPSFQFTTLIAQPVYFCNPVEKTFRGVVNPIVDPVAHITVYEFLDPLFFGQSWFAADQFGQFPFHFGDGRYLEVPTEKLSVINTEEQSWGSLKAHFD